jgi:Domain of unknown function (DUF4926)
MGTVLMDFDKLAYLIDFADSEGHTYAMETIPFSKLMLLLDKPLLTV